MTQMIPITDLIGNSVVSIELTGLRAWKVRLWFGAMFMYFGIWITGMNAEVEIKAGDD